MKLNATMHKLQRSVLKYMLIASVILLANCSFSQKQEQNPISMNPKKALIAAINFFPENEFDAVENYQISLSENASDYTVQFTRYRPAKTPGGHLAIVVPKDNGALTIMRGE